MPKPRTLEEVYDRCVSEGQIAELSESNVEMAKGLTLNADISVDSAKALSKLFSKSDKGWLAVFTSHHDALQMYARALLILHKVSSHDPQCLFASLCLKNPDFDWDFFERIRTLREGIDHNGKQIGHPE